MRIFSNLRKEIVLFSACGWQAYSVGKLTSEPSGPEVARQTRNAVQRREYLPLPCRWLANAKDMKGPRRSLLVGQIFERNTHTTRWLQEQPSSSCTLHFFFPPRSSQQRNNVLPTYSEIWSSSPSNHVRIRRRTSRCIKNLVRTVLSTIYYAEHITNHAWYGVSLISPKLATRHHNKLRLLFK